MDLRQPEPLTLGTNAAEGWKEFKQRWQFFYEGSGLDNKAQKKQCAVFMHTIGKEGQDVYQTFTINEDEKDIDSLIAKFDEVFLPKTNITYERFRFNNCSQKSDQSFDSFLTELRGLAKTCEYGQLKDSLIKDRIVCGIKEKKLQTKLLAADPDLAAAIEGCRAWETAHTQAQSINKTESTNEPDAEVHKMKASNRRNNSEQERRNRWERQPGRPCYYCGKTHAPRNCPAFGNQCEKCGKMNHFASVCKNRQIKNLSLQEDPDSTNQSEYVFIGAVHTSLDDQSGWRESININQHDVVFKLDPGANANTMALDTYKRIGGRIDDLIATKAQLIGYTEDYTVPIGLAKLQCQIRGKFYGITFHVTEQNLPNLLGLHMCEKANLVQRINNIDTHNPLTKNTIIKNFPEVFKGIGCIPYTHKIQLKHDAQPVVHAPRRIPQKLKPRVIKEIKRLEAVGVIKAVSEATEWVNHLVTVNKPDGSIRLCMEAKELNECIIPCRHKLNTIEEIAASMPDAKYFSKFDAFRGFWQIPLDEASSKLCTFNSPLGRYRFTRLPFGIVDASEVFQKAMEELFGDIAHVLVDDILVSGKTRQEHDEKVIEVMRRARKNNLKLNVVKLMIGVQTVAYSGHLLTSEGLKPDPQKVKAITQMPSPLNKSQLKSFLGMINYLTKFLPKLSSESKSLRELLKDDVEFIWEAQQEECFKNLKKILREDATLAYYDVDKAVTLQVDASKSGIGACLMQQGKPIFYASTSLTQTQQRYAQIEKEMLAVVFACKRFHDLIYGKPTNIHTDHKPLQAIFNKSLADAPPRIARMMLGLQKYKLNVSWKPGKEMFIADALSRNYIDEEDEELNSEEFDIEVNAMVKNLPVSAAKYTEFQTETSKDPEAKKLKEVLLKGWPKYQKDLHNSLKPFWSDRGEFFLNDGIIYKGQRIYIPKTMRNQMLNLLHEGHFGIQKTLSRAATIMYWPGISKDIENVVKSCDMCIRYRRSQQKEPMVSHDIPSRPWEEISIDFLEIEKQKWLVTVDCYSSFFELSPMNQNTKAPALITQLKSIFARLGVPEVVYSDNGPPFDSTEYNKFAEEYNFKIKTSSPLYPQSNGKVESAVKIAKGILLKATDKYAALMEYRASPLASLGKSPAELLYGRPIRTKLPSTTKFLDMKTSMTEVIKEKMKINKEREKHYYDKTAGPELEELDAGDDIYVQRGKQWEPAKVIRDTGNRSYQIQPDNGQEIRRNSRYLLRRRDVT